MEDRDQAEQPALAEEADRLVQGWRDELRALAAMLSLGLLVVLPLRNLVFPDTALIPGLLIFPLLALVQFSLLRRRMRARGLSDGQDHVWYAMGSAIAMAPAVVGADPSASGIALWIVVLLAWLGAIGSVWCSASLAPRLAPWPRRTAARWLAAGTAALVAALVAALPVAWGTGLLTRFAAISLPCADGDLGEVAGVVPAAIRPHATHVWRRTHRGSGEWLPDVVQVSFRLPPSDARTWQAALARDGRREVVRRDLLDELAGPDVQGYELLRRRRIHVRVPGKSGYGLGYLTMVEGAISPASGAVVIVSSRWMNPEGLPPGTRAGEGEWVDVPTPPDEH